MDLTGAFTALVTPFTADGSIDDAALRNLVRYQIEAGIAGIVACGTTAETPTLTDAERLRVVELVVEEAAGRCPIIAGAGGNDTAHVCRQAKDMEGRGVSALLSVSPYYNRPSQDGLLQHFRAIADATELPVILYNVPGRTGSTIEVSTVLQLAEHPGIVSIKEASGRIAVFDELIERVPTGFSVLSGDDSCTLPAMSLGARGVISVASNLVPGRVQRLTEAVIAGDLERARRLHFALAPLARACFLDTNPVPVKAGLALLGLLNERFRLPLVPTDDSVRTEMRRCLVALGLDVSDAPKDERATA